MLVTSLHVDDTLEDANDLPGSDKTGRFRMRKLRLELAVNGAGDAIAALFFPHYLRSGKINDALSKAALAIFGVLTKTADVGEPENQVVAAQREIVEPSKVFEAEEL